MVTVYRSELGPCHTPLSSATPCLNALISSSSAFGTDGGGWEGGGTIGRLVGCQLLEDEDPVVIEGGWEVLAWYCEALPLLPCPASKSAAFFPDEKDGCV